MPHMAEGPEQLEVGNQCPTVSLDDVSHKHNIDPRYKLEKSWHFIADFIPKDISYHHSFEDYQDSFSGRAHTTFLPGYSNKIHIICFRFY